MARSSIPVSQVTRAGTTVVAGQAADTVNGHVLNNGGSPLLLVKNTDSTNAGTVTIHVPGVVDGATINSKTVSVPASTSMLIGPFPSSIYGSTVNIDLAGGALTVAGYYPTTA